MKNKLEIGKTYITDKGFKFTLEYISYVKNIAGIGSDILNGWFGELFLSDILNGIEDGSIKEYVETT